MPDLAIRFGRTIRHAVLVACVSMVIAVPAHAGSADGTISRGSDRASASSDPSIILDAGGDAILGARSRMSPTGVEWT